MTSRRPSRSLLPDMEAVAAVIREVAAEAILPRFQRLAHGDVSEKAPGDLLTIADVEAERALERRLPALLPGSVVVGEEGVFDKPALLEMLRGEQPVWLVDPIDGTINFAAGLPLFATMVALIVRGEVRAAWILDPVHDVMAMAARGQGATYDGRPARTAPPADLARWSGCLHLSRHDPDLSAVMARNLARVGPVLVLHCAGLEYQAMLLGRMHYAVYHWTNPWDHAAGLLLVEEAGGRAAHLDGTPLDAAATRRDRPPFLVAASREGWLELRTALFEAG